METQPLQTERLLLRKVEQSDNHFVLEGLSNDTVTEFMLIRYYTLETVQEQMDWYANHYKNQTGYYWLMELKETKEPIGVIGYHAVSFLHKKAELGFWLLPKFWKQGFVTEASKATLGFMFDVLQLNRIEATVETENPASINAIKKLDFTHEGTFREYEMNNGKFIDLMMFALLKKDRE
jgi:ribosomal-protein-alanine N-acetyltransferase